MSYEDPK